MEDDRVGNHVKGILNGGFGLIQGMGLTLKHLFQPPITVQYPDERWRPAHGFRGIPVLTIDEETGSSSASAAKPAPGPARPK